MTSSVKTIAIDLAVKILEECVRFGEVPEDHVVCIFCSRKGQVGNIDIFSPLREHFSYVQHDEDCIVQLARKVVFNEIALDIMDR